MTNTPAELSGIVDSIVQIIDAYDTFNVYKNLTPQQKLERAFLLSNEERETLESCGHIDEKYRAQITIFFQALALTIEKQIGNTVGSIVELNEEGFGQAVIYSGHLVLISMGLRGTQQFAFSDVIRIEKRGDKMIKSALDIVERFPEILKL